MTWAISEFLNALEFARERGEGNDTADAGIPDAKRVTVIHHPDVRRSLLPRKAYVEGPRAVYLYAAAHRDVVSAEIVSGDGHDRLLLRGHHRDPGQ